MNIPHPQSVTDRRIGIRRVLPHTTTDSSADTNSYADRQSNHNQRNQNLDPDLRSLVQARHTPAHHILRLLSSHRLLLHLHGFLAWPDLALHIPGLALEQTHITTLRRLLSCQTRFDIGIIRRGVYDVDVLFRLGFLSFE